MSARRCCCSGEPGECRHDLGCRRRPCCRKTTGTSWKPQPQGTWLLIRYDTTDTGVRPIPSGDVWWTSPDIWLTGGDAFGNPVGGQPAVIYARVWNLGGLVAFPTTVSFSFIQPFLALPGGDVPTFIGTEYALIPSLGYAEVTVPWTPPNVAGDVHTCIAVTCSCALTNDVPSVPGNAVADRHTGQRNLTLVGASVRNFEFQLNMVNLRPWDAAVQLGVRALWSNAADLISTDPMDIASLQTAVRAIDVPHTQMEYRLLARRAALLSDQKTECYSLVPAAQVNEIVQITAMRLGRRYRRGSIAPPRNRINATYPSITPIGNAVDLKVLQHATVRFAVRVPEPTDGRKWLILNIVQVTEGLIDGGYTVALRVVE